MEGLDGFKMGWDLLWSMLTAEPLLTWSIIIFIGASVLFSYIVETIKEQQIRKSGIREIDKMSGRKFEEYLKAFFKASGYDVKLTPASGDYGADLILKLKGKKFIVQAKRYKNNVGVKAVQEIASAQSYYKADECWVITNRSYTEQAKKLAVTNHVKLFDRKQLMNWIMKNNKRTKAEKISS